jgi:hypothetical protein
MVDGFCFGRNLSLVRLWCVLIALLNTGCCTAPRRADAGFQLERLRIGQSRIVSVDARSTWSPTGIFVAQNDRYRFEPLPPDQWYDFFHKTSSVGYPSICKIQANFEAKRRVPSAPWFALCGSVTPAGAAFIASAAQSMPREGLLGLFPNDVPCAYWNNWGTIGLRITRVR